MTFKARVILHCINNALSVELRLIARLANSLNDPIFLDQYDKGSWRIDISAASFRHCSTVKVLNFQSPRILL